jgi:hypothetical protein
MFPNETLGMTPSTITPAQWSQITTTLIWLWVFVVAMIFFAFSVLLSLGMIPSLMSTNQVTQRAGFIRPFLYALAAFFLFAVAFSFTNFVMNATVLLEIYRKAWI